VSRRGIGRVLGLLALLVAGTAQPACVGGEEEDSACECARPPPFIIVRLAPAVSEGSVEAWFESRCFTDDIEPDEDGDPIAEIDYLVLQLRDGGEDVDYVVRDAVGDVVRTTTAGADFPDRCCAQREVEV
jgi:hypothetical protein